MADEGAVTDVGNGYEGLDLVPEAVVVIAADGTIRHANDRAGVVLDLTDGVGRAFDDVVALEDATGAACGIAVLPEAGDRMAERLMRVVLADERRRAVSVAARRLDDGWVLTFRSAGRRERVDAARADVVATVSHEIRSPLTSVKGFTKTMLRRWDRFSDEQKFTMLETINEDADRVTRLLTELLDVSRIDAGRVQLHKQMVDVPALAHKIAEAAVARHEGRDVVVEAPDEELRVYGDPDKLNQVLTNIVENALHYASESQVRITVTPTADRGARVSVADDGPGIPEDQRRRIFEKFGRGRGVRRSGTGLGLFITRGLVRAHGGDVVCESIVGEGTTFHVDVPWGDPPGL